MYVICQVLPNLPGRYYNYDEEGYVDVYQKNSDLFVKNRPNNNDKVYTHKLFNV